MSVGAEPTIRQPAVAASARTESDALVLFGATGDLAHKLIFPALQRLAQRGRLDVPVIGVASSAWSSERFLDRVIDSLRAYGEVDQGAIERLRPRLRYVQGDYRDPSTFDRVVGALGSCVAPLHYLAIPPSLFATVIEGMDRAGCARGARVVLEKPLGRDRASAAALDAVVHRAFPESSVFRIDHFLGKEPVQNILYFRFANGFVESIWDRHHIESVQITMAESFGVEGRGALYDELGAIRDVLQNHLLQLVASVAMDPPSAGDVEGERDERARLLRSIVPLRPQDVVRGQFRGYRGEPGVAPDSDVETYVAVRLAIDTWRWAGVPFFIRAGKAMASTYTEAVITFRPAPRSVFGNPIPPRADYLRLRVSPVAEIAQGLCVKAPGEAMIGRAIELLASASSAGDMLPYERLIDDAMRGDARLFARSDMVDAEWRVVEPVLGGAVPLHAYQPGSWGPPEADALVRERGGWAPEVPS